MYRIGDNMKQVKLEDILKTINCVDKNHLCSRLMGFLLNEISQFEKNNNDEMAQYYNDIWAQLYDLLDEVGYYDQFK